MSETCKFCQSIKEVDHGICDDCWYEMRLEPEEFQERMDKIGTRVVRQNPHVKIEIEGKPCIASRDPFVLYSEAPHE